MRINFTKMHGLGNDFVLINAMGTDLTLSQDQIMHLADRHFGIGCDQVLLLQDSENNDADLFYRIFNADGAEVEHCGNGIRCVGKYLKEKRIITKDIIQAETIKGIISIHFNENDWITVDMGIPGFEPDEIPINTVTREASYALNLTGRTLTARILSVGNPHAVIQVDHLEEYPVEEIGQEIQQLSLFPESVNVGFMELHDKGKIGLRVYERGVGETLACGTGACAAMAAGYLYAGLDNEVNISLKGGQLAVKWEGEGKNLWMSGPAASVFEGHITI